MSRVQSPAVPHAAPTHPDGALAEAPVEGRYPQGDGTLRWWDGRDWTADVRPAAREAS